MQPWEVHTSLRLQPWEDLHGQKIFLLKPKEMGQIPLLQYPIYKRIPLPYTIVYSTLFCTSSGTRSCNSQIDSEKHNTQVCTGTWEGKTAFISLLLMLDYRMCPWIHGPGLPCIGGEGLGGKESLWMGGIADRG